MADDTTRPATGPAARPEAGPTTGPATGSAARPTTGPAAGAATGPATGPAAGAAARPASGAATRPASGSATRNDGASVGEVVDYVKAYAKQETLGPLRGAGTWIAMGAAAAAALGIGICLLLLGLLRVLQVETDLGTSEYWSWVPYGIVLLVGGLIAAIVVSRINKTYLDKKDKR